MFKKLLKYDFQSLKRIGLPVLIMILASTVVISVFAGVMVSNDGYGEVFGILEIMATVFVAFAGIAIMCSPLIIQIMVYENFYRTLTTDEGYLTFTLPVKAKDIIFAKLTNGTIWTLISGVAVGLSAFIVALTVVIAKGGGGGSSEPVPVDPISGMAVACIILGILFAIVSYFATQIAYFIIIFWGSTIFKIKKSSNIIWLLIIGNFIISAITSTFSSIISSVGTIITKATGNYELGMLITLIVLVLFAGGLMVGAFFLLKHLMEKKVNLP
ncbi:MAG: hypothetical protein J6D23_02310 [Clostridia bacterium]|nr:hypothetical protein [Clostridia bacterium]